MGSRTKGNRRTDAVSEQQCAENPILSVEPPSLLPATVSPLIARAQRLFRRDLPRLLLSHDGQWVAYRGDQQVGFGDSMLDLYRECFRMGIKPDELVVRLIDAEQLAEELEVDITHDV